MYKKKWLYWPIFFALILVFMFASAPYKQTHFKGPYISWKEKNGLEWIYLSIDTAKRIHVNVENTEVIELAGRLSDRNKDYSIMRNPRALSDNIQGVDSILILGNVNGVNSKLFSFLQSNKVIDSEGQWNWGKGHLVLNGNLIGRGDQVTETLWFVYHLEQEAARAGGAVHYLLGTNEIEVLSGNYQTISKQYLDLFKRLKVPYQNQFSNSGVFGQWMRSRNTVIKLNDMLISYSGISPKIKEMGIEINQQNRNIIRYLTLEEEDSLTQILLETDLSDLYKNNPKGEQNKENKDQQSVEEILKEYDAARIIVANKVQDSITASYGGKVYSVSMNVEDWRTQMEGLLYKKGKLSRLKMDRTSIDLNN